MMVKVAVAQMDPKLGRNAENLERILALFREATVQGAKLVVFPECATSGYGFGDLAAAYAAADVVPGPITEALARACAEADAYVVVGVLERFGSAEVYNSAVLVGPEGELLTRARENGVAVDVIDPMRRAINPWRDLAACRALCRAIREYRPHVVHTHSSKAGILGRYAAKRCGVPCIVHTIHGLPFHPYETPLKNRLYVFLEKKAAKKCDLIITVADAMTEQALAAGVGERSVFRTIYSGIEIDMFRPLSAKERDDVRRRLGVPPDAAVICKVARLFELKGHEFLLRAMPRIIEKIPSARLVLVGDGGLPVLQDNSLALGQTRQVLYLPSRSLFCKL